MTLNSRFPASLLLYYKHEAKVLILWGTGDWTQNFMHTKQVVYQLSYTLNSPVPSLSRNPTLRRTRFCVSHVSCFCASEVPFQEAWQDRRASLKTQCIGKYKARQPQPRHRVEKDLLHSAGRRASEYFKINVFLKLRECRTSPRKHISIYTVVDSFLSMLT